MFASWACNFNVILGCWGDPIIFFQAVWRSTLLDGGTTHSWLEKWGTRIESMYFLLIQYDSMVIFQPAMLVYWRVEWELHKKTLRTFGDLHLFRMTLVHPGMLMSLGRIHPWKCLKLAVWIMDIPVLYLKHLVTMFWYKGLSWLLSHASIFVDSLQLVTKLTGFRGGMWGWICWTSSRKRSAIWDLSPVTRRPDSWKNRGVRTAPCKAGFLF